MQYWKRHENLCPFKNNIKDTTKAKLVPYDSSDEDSQPALKRMKPSQPAVSNSSDENCVSFRNVLSTYSILPNSENQGDLKLFSENTIPEICSKLRNAFNSNGSLKWYAVVEVQFKRAVTTSEDEFCSAFFRSNCQIILTDNELTEQVSEAIEKMLKSFESFEGLKSGWVIDFVKKLEIKTGLYRPLSGSSYIPLPTKLKNKHAIVNIKNIHDNKCFLWCVLAHLYPVRRHANRVQAYKNYENALNTSMLKFPVSLPSITKFEDLNNVSINVFGYKREIFPLRITKKRNVNHINLLMLKNAETNHFCLIKNLNALLSSLTKHKGQMYYCNYCLQRFTTKLILQNHVKCCKTHDPQKITYPSEDNKWLEFKNYYYQLPVPFVIYADFEALLFKIDTVENNPSTSHTTQKNKHYPCGYSYVIASPNGEYVSKPVVYRGNNAIDHFLKSLLMEESKIQKILRNPKNMIISLEEEERFKNEKNCHICEKELKNDRVRDHDHISGLYRGAAHNSCNLNYKYTNVIPVVIHNLRGYDEHLIMSGIGKVQNKRISCIPNNMQKYVSFSIGSLRFIDSYQFLNTSLENLVQNLPKEKFYILKKYFPDSKDWQLLLRKGVYPYSYMDSWQKFSETCLPPPEAFFNDLTSEHIPQEDYKHAQTVWDRFKIKTLGEYHDFYVKLDVLLLSDVFQNFRNLCLKFYRLDPCHMFTAAGLAWQACLRMTGIRLELLTDPDMFLFFESGIRGGISMITKRYSKANNKYLADFRSDEPSKYIMYLDANNLYGWAMVQHLPVRGFQWLTQREMSSIDVMDIPDDGDTGYVFCVDLEVPTELHDFMNDYPLAPETFMIQPEMLSEYSKNLAENYNKKPSGVKKLMPNLYDKNSYVIHYRNLKQCLKLGIKLKKIIKGIKFTQTAWLKQYVEFNTLQRKNATNNFEKDFFKLLNNSVYGKTMENLRNRVDVKLVQEDKKLKKLIASPTFHAYTIFNENLVGVHMKKVNLTLNRPIYTGFCILDISKTLMFNFHYEYISKKYPGKATLLFTDTDSLCYEIYTEDIYDDMLHDSFYYDMSDYPENHKAYSSKNKKILGKMKDELSGVPAIEFVGLRSKMYSLLTENDERKRAKGVQRNVVRHIIKHNDYKNVLFNEERKSVSATKILSTDHELFTVVQRKLALSAYDDKRFILNNKIETLAYGHKSIGN